MVSFDEDKKKVCFRVVFQATPDFRASKRHMTFGRAGRVVCQPDEYRTYLIEPKLYAIKSNRISIEPIEYYLEFGGSIEIRLRSAIEFQSFDCIQLVRSIVTATCVNLWQP